MIEEDQIEVEKNDISGGKLVPDDHNSDYNDDVFYEDFEYFESKSKEIDGISQRTRKARKKVIGEDNLGSNEKEDLAAENKSYLDLGNAQEDSDGGSKSNGPPSGYHNTACCCGQIAKCFKLQAVFCQLATYDPSNFSHRIGYCCVPKPNNINYTTLQKNRNKRASLYGKYLGTSARK